MNFISVVVFLKLISMIDDFANIKNISPEMTCSANVKEELVAKADNKNCFLSLLLSAFSDAFDIRCKI
jgi:hypothetical protein